MPDLEVFYHRKISNVGSIVEDSIGENREASRIIAKTLPKTEHHIGSVRDLSSEELGEEFVLLGGAGKGNVLFKSTA